MDDSNMETAYRARANNGPANLVIFLSSIFLFGIVRLPKISDAMLQAAVTSIEQHFEDFGVAANSQRSELSSDDIPEIPRELEDPIRALARAAYLFRGVFLEAADGKAIRDIITDRADTLRLADRVLNSWWSHLDLHVGDER